MILLQRNIHAVHFACWAWFCSFFLEDSILYDRPTWLNNLACSLSVDGISVHYSTVVLDEKALSLWKTVLYLRNRNRESGIRISEEHKKKNIPAIFDAIYQKHILRHERKRLTKKHEALSIHAQLYTAPLSNDWQFLRVHFLFLRTYFL